MSVFGKGIARVCAVAAAATATGLAGQVRQALRETLTVELRLDWMKNDGERKKFLVWLKKNRVRGAVYLATCRRREGGGRFRGSVEAELKWLREASEAGCAWADLEIESRRKLRGATWKSYGLPRRVLLSMHDFQRTPPLEPIFQKMSRVGDADGVKITAQSRTIADSVRVMELARHSGNCVAVAMGETGLPARLLALREGSALAYAPVADATAPGQVSLHDFKYLYRAHELNERTKVFGVIGDPIGHSLSPLLHNTGFVAEKINAVYLPFLVKDLRDFLKAVPEFGLRGFSVTLPHKTSLLKHMDACDPLAAEIGAVNTVVVGANGSLHGYNTDYVGVLRALQKKLRLAKNRILIFGAGGSARAAAFALARSGASVFVCARKERAARELAHAVGGEAVPRHALKSQAFDAIVNTTPVGMYPHEEISPLETRELNCRMVMDFIYRPEKTKLLKLAASKGITTVSGVEMFLAQGVAQWEMWMKRRAPEAAMLRTVRNALRQERNRASGNTR